MPKKFIPRTSKQNKILHGLLNAWGFTADDKAEMVFDITSGRTESSKEMSVDEANEMIHRLNAKKEPPGESRRNIQHRRQVAGVVQMVTPEHLAKLEGLARGRKMTGEGLDRLCLRMIKSKRPKTTLACNKIIEAIKAMNARDKQKKETPNV